MTDDIRIGGARLRLVRGDITEQDVDAIVNAANSSLMGGGGVDGAIHARGGPSILEESKRVRDHRYPDGLPTGEAVATTAGALPATVVIHTVGPIWKGGGSGEPERLSAAYRNSLLVAIEGGCRRVAFPSISTGVYGYPVEAAAPLALGTIRDVLEESAGSMEEVRLVLFSEAHMQVYRSALGELSP